MLGRQVAFHQPADARAEGIEVVYQDLALCDNLTAAANVYPRAGAHDRASARSGS